MATRECQCSICGRHYTYSRRKGHTLEKCNTCRAIAKRAGSRFSAIKEAGNQCSHCGYCKSKRALRFYQHTYPYEPIHMTRLVSMHSIFRDRVIAHSLLLCGNCWAELRDGLWKL